MRISGFVRNFGGTYLANDTSTRIRSGTITPYIRNDAVLGWNSIWACVEIHMSD